MNRTGMKRWMFAALAACGLWAAACGNMGIEEEVEYLSSEQKTLVDDMESVNNQLQVMKTDIQTLQDRTATMEEMITQSGAGGGGNPQQIQAINQQLDNLRKAVEQLNNNLNQLKTQVARGGGSSSAAPARTSTTPSNTAARSERETAPRPTPTPEETPAAGFWAKPEPGDTFETFAARHNVTPAQIREGNRIPEGQQLYAGQNYWIPR